MKSIQFIFVALFIGSVSEISATRPALMPSKLKIGILTDASTGAPYSYVLPKSPLNPSCDCATSIATNLGQATGFDIKLAAEMFKRLSKEVEFVQYSGPRNTAFAQLQKDVANGTIDIAAHSGTFVTPFRLAETPMIATVKLSREFLAVGVLYNPLEAFCYENKCILPSVPPAEPESLWNALKDAISVAIIVDQASVWEKILKDRSIECYSSSEYVNSTDTANPDQIAQSLSLTYFSALVTDAALAPAVLASKLRTTDLQCAVAPIPADLLSGTSTECFGGWRCATHLTPDLLFSMQVILDDMILDGTWTRIFEETVKREKTFWHCVGTLATMESFLLGHPSKPALQTSSTLAFFGPKSR
jgi:hypothetical protein